MGNTPPTLDYAAAKPGSRLRKWSRRILLAVLVLACLYATPIAWLYWGWKQEQPAREMVARVGGEILRTEPAGPAFMERLMPAPLDWTRERITAISFDTPATDDDLGTLRPLRRLQWLQLNGGNVTDAALVHLGGLTGLQWLSLAGTRVTGAGLVHIEGLAKLQRLFLDCSPVTDAGLVHVRGLTGLQYLYLDGTEVTDAGLVHIRGLTGLQRLDFANTRVTDAGLVHLRGLTGLKWLSLAGTKVTDAGVAELQKALPQCQIFR